MFSYLHFGRLSLLAIIVATAACTSHSPYQRVTIRVLDDTAGVQRNADTVWFTAKLLFRNDNRKTVYHNNPCRQPEVQRESNGEWVTVWRPHCDDLLSIGVMQPNTQGVESVRILGYPDATKKPAWGAADWPADMVTGRYRLVVQIGVGLDSLGKVIGIRERASQAFVVRDTTR